MSRFLTKLWLEHVDGNTWVLAAPLIYESDYLKKIVKVKAGTDTDLASVPDILRGWFPKSGKWNPDAVLHDAGYFDKLWHNDSDILVHLTKAESDKLFHEALLVSGIGKKLANLFYWAVSNFGRVEK